MSMTNNDELALKLKAAALNATPGKWSYARSGFNSIVQAPVNMARGGASRVMVCALKRAGWRGELATAIDAAFIAEANPENILALLAERDADKKRIAELEAHVDANADLETEIVSALVGSGHLDPNTTLMQEALLQIMRQALEARTVSVKLPSKHNNSGFVTDGIYNKGIDDCYLAFMEALAAAGINLEVGE